MSDTIPVVAASVNTTESFIESDEIESVLAEAKQLIQMKPISSLSGKLVKDDCIFLVGQVVA